MPEPTSGIMQSPLNYAEFKNWKPEAQQQAIELLREYEQSHWRPFYCQNPVCNGRPHDDWTWNHARADQRPPKWTDDWLTLLLSGGRGSGKTRTGSEITHRVSNLVPRVILIAPTGYDLRETMVEGVSGILATAAPGKRPLWEPSKKKLTWPNGCIGQGFSAEEPDRLRGPNSGFIWGDEPAHWPLVAECWSNMQFGLRMKEGFGGVPIKPKIIATSTPRPIKWMKELIAQPLTITRRVSTYENLDNLADSFKATILDRYEGTRLGRQELHGELLEDVEGALWTWDMIEWVAEAPRLVKIVVGVDPAGTANKKSDETGIIVVGISEAKVLYVLDDGSGKYTPAGWAGRANGMYDDFAANFIVAEKNYGADMVKHTLETSGYSGAKIELVQSRRGKDLRAEPIVALYEKGRVKHVGKQGDLMTLEEEMTTWIPGEGASPNRVDALVHACTELAKHAMPSAVADPNKLLRRANMPNHLYAV